MVIALAVFLGLYFGMRNDPGQVTEPAPAPATAPPAVPSQVPTPPSPELIARVQADATQALEALRHDMLAACPPPAGTRVEISSSVAFDKDGQEVAWGMTPKDVGGAAVEQCIRQHFHTFRIPAPGRTVSVTVPLVLP